MAMMNNMKKKIKSKITKHEIVVKVESQPAQFLKETDLGPEKEGSKYMIPKTWISEKQVLKVIQKTPPQHIYKRKGKGGQMFDYVTGTYVTKVLNFVFGWNWDFEIITHGEKNDQIWVQGKLTVKDDKGHTITKSQFGRADVKFLKGTNKPVDFGNDLKAASTDALKKCASMLGIASDVYGKMEYRQEADLNIQNAPTPQISLTEARPKTNVDQEIQICQGCDSIISEQEAEFSKKIYKKKLCRNCQKSEKNNEN